MTTKITNKKIEALHVFENKLNKEMNTLDKRILQMNCEMGKILHRKKKIKKAVSDNMKYRNKLINELATNNIR